MLLLCHFGTPHTFALRLPFALAPSNSFVSPTSRKSARNPFVSPTYAKTGGWGGCYPYGNVSTICRRADNFASRGPPPSYGGQAEASPYTNHQQRVTSHAGNVLNCKLSTEHPTRMLILSESGESKDHSSSESATLNCRLSLPRGWRKLSLSAILSCTHAVVRGSPRIQEHAYE